MHDLNGALFLKATFFSVLSLSFAAAAGRRSVVPFTAICASLQSHKPDRNIEVLNLKFLLTEYYSLDKSFTLVHFFVTNFDTDESFNNLDIM